MSWAAKVAAASKKNHSQNGSDQKKDDSVVFKPEAANGAPINIGKSNLSFGSFSDEKDVVNPVPQRKNPAIPVS